MRTDPVRDRVSREEAASVSLTAAALPATGDGGASPTEPSAVAAGKNPPARVLFHHLINVEEYPSVLPAAAHYVAQCLHQVARDRQQRRGRFPYAESAFERWIEGVYRHQLGVPLRRRSSPRLPRTAYVFGIEQLAPAILVDGCWLQRADTLVHVAAPVARRLFAIYADELGNGMVARNHARIYRSLLDSLGIDCPPVESLAFARSRRFLDTAFDLPVLLLSISVNVHRYLPELLGLNLAIEISGLGASYGQLARDLEYWGIDAQIVRLHQSIDNLASGHAALAKEAILLHLRQIRALGGEETQQAHWSRILAGYHLLRVVTRGFKWRLVVAYLAHRAAERIRALTFASCRSSGG